ncbi:hypothetical protein NXS19_011699 [Fusarium pseudograminearum]|nr:hypothetical protein NXS19_011699 [Fusarium pseudograminearum]
MSYVSDSANVIKIKMLTWSIWSWWLSQSGWRMSLNFSVYRLSHRIPHTISTKLADHNGFALNGHDLHWLFSCQPSLKGHSVVEVLCIRN